MSQCPTIALSESDSFQRRTTPSYNHINTQYSLSLTSYQSTTPGFFHITLLLMIEICLLKMGAQGITRIVSLPLRARHHHGASKAPRSCFNRTVLVKQDSDMSSDDLTVYGTDDGEAESGDTELGHSVVDTEVDPKTANKVICSPENGYSTPQMPRKSTRNRKQTRRMRESKEMSEASNTTRQYRQNRNVEAMVEAPTKSTTTERDTTGFDTRSGNTTYGVDIDYDIAEDPKKPIQKFFLVESGHYDSSRGRLGENGALSPEYGINSDFSSSEIEAFARVEAILQDPQWNGDYTVWASPLSGQNRHEGVRFLHRSKQEPASAILELRTLGLWKESACTLVYMASKDPCVRWFAKMTPFESRFCPGRND